MSAAPGKLELYERKIMEHSRAAITLSLTPEQLDAGGYEKWELETIYCLPGCGVHFYSPDGIGRIFTGDDYDLAEMIGDQGDRFIEILEA
jgi:hypothetical protein